MNAPAFCIRTTRDFLLRPRLRLFLCPPRSPPPPRRLRRSVDDIRGEDIVVAKPDEDEDVHDDETTLLAFSSSARRKLRRPPKPPLERPDDIVVKAPLRRARIALPRRAKERLCTCDEISKSFVQFLHTMQHAELFDHQKDRREEKEESAQLFVPPSLFLLVAFEDECKDRTRVLTRYVRV